jgi:hypothetical protein
LNRLRAKDVEDLGGVLMKELWMMVVVDEVVVDEVVVDEVVVDEVVVYEDKGRGKLTELCRSCWTLIQKLDDQCLNLVTTVLRTSSSNLFCRWNSRGCRTQMLKDRDVEGQHIKGFIEGKQNWILLRGLMLRG